VTADVILAIDQGTSSTRTVAYDPSLRPVASVTARSRVRHPRPGWVEKDADEILESVVATVGRVLAEIGGPGRVAAVGLDNEGETVVAWDAETRQPLAPAIVWQCRRSLPIVERLQGRALADAIRIRTGLPLDPYFSAAKLTWLLEQSSSVQAAAARGSLRLGTIDAWVTAALGDTGPITDPSTASRTQLLSLSELRWDPQLLDWFGIPASTLPTIVQTAGELATIRHASWHGGLPLRAMACDQQAALAGHGGFAAGSVKATYGTGVFVLANAGPRREARPGLETSIAWRLPDGTTDAVLQGGVFSAGALIDWLASGLHFLPDPGAAGDLASSVRDSHGVIVLPALAGLGAPWWRPSATGVIAGLTAGARPAHVVRAALDGIAHRVADVLETIVAALPTQPRSLRVDGGLSSNAYLMQRQADLIGVPVEVAATAESTALGMAVLAGLGEGLLSPRVAVEANPVRARFTPRVAPTERRRQRNRWRSFVEAAVVL
jgi:glycerol kinase